MSQPQEMPVQMPPRAIAATTISWCLVGVAAWDGAGYAFGSSAFATDQSFALLRQFPIGGMRGIGVILLAGAIAVAFGIGQDGRQHPHMLNRLLSIGVAVYVAWTLVIPITWWYVHAIPAWGAASKPAVLALLYYFCARAFARPRLQNPGGRHRRGAQHELRMNHPQDRPHPPATPASHPEARRLRHRPRSGTEPGHARG